MAKNDRDMENAIITLRLAAEVANGSAQQIIAAYRRKPVFCSNSSCPAIARAQQRANARKRLLREHRVIEHLASVVHEQGGDAIDLIRRVSALKTSPVLVGDQSFPTAHEAAMILGDTVLSAWQDAGGDDAVELAPDRRHAEHNADDADIAIEVSLELWRRLQELRDRLPADLWGQIQQEHLAAWQSLGDETPLGPPPSTGKATPKKRGRQSNPTRDAEMVEAYNLALKNGECSSQADFAQSKGMAPATFSKLKKRVEAAEKERRALN